MKEIIATITSKGQVTIPAEVRNYLGLRTNDRVAFVIDAEGQVKLKVPRYPKIASLRGAAGKLSKSLSWQPVWSAVVSWAGRKPIAMSKRVGLRLYPSMPRKRTAYASIFCAKVVSVKLSG